MIARLNFANGIVSEAHELGCVKGFVEIDDVNEMMRDAPAFGGGRLGGADVEPAVNLHGIGGNDFAVELLSARRRVISDLPEAVGAGEEEDRDEKMVPLAISVLDVTRGAPAGAATKTLGAGRR